MTSACEVLNDEPERFVSYILADPNLRSKIVDKKSFGIALDKALRSDSSLKNIAETIHKAGEDIEVCGGAIFDNPEIQNIIEKNSKTRLRFFRKRVREQHPHYGRRRVNKEAHRRLKISIGIQRSSLLRSTRQVTIDEALRPIKIKYVSKGKKIEYSKAKPRKLTMAQEMLITNNIHKSVKDVVKLYYDAGLSFRSATSIKRHYQNIRKDLNIEANSLKSTSSIPKRFLRRDGDSSKLNKLTNQAELERLKKDPYFSRNKE